MSHPILLDRISQCGRNLRLANQIIKRFWSIAQGNDAIFLSRDGVCVHADYCMPDMAASEGITARVISVGDGIKRQNIRCKPQKMAISQQSSPKEKLTVGQRAPHKSTPLMAAPYFRPDPVHGSPSRSPLPDSSIYQPRGLMALVVRLVGHCVNSLFGKLFPSCKQIKKIGIR